MGAVVSVAKKVWSGIKKVAKAVWNGVKTVVKKTVEIVKKTVKIIVNGIIKVVEVAAVLVASAVITAALAVYGLGLLAVGVLSLPVIFISSLIKFGRTKENVEINDNINVCVNPTDNKPNFEEAPKKKKLNMKGDFEEDFKSYYNDAKNREAKPKDFFYSFVKDDKTNECLSERNNGDDDKKILSNTVVSYINFEPIVSKNQTYVQLSINNEVDETNDETCRKIMEDIKEICSESGKVIITNTKDKTEETDLKKIKDFETIVMNIEF